MTFLNDLKRAPSPERQAYLRGFVQALMIADLLGKAGAYDILWRTSITEDDIRGCGLDAADTRKALQLHARPEAAP